MKEEVSKFAELMCGALIKKYPSKDHPDIEKVKRGVKSLVQRYIVSSQEPLKLLEVRHAKYNHLISSNLDSRMCRIQSYTEIIFKPNRGNVNSYSSRLSSIDSYLNRMRS